MHLCYFASLKCQFILLLSKLQKVDFTYFIFLFPFLFLFLFFYFHDRRLSRTKKVNLTFFYFLLLFLFYFLYSIFRTRVRVRVTRSYCHTADHIRWHRSQVIWYMEGDRRFWKDDIIQYIIHMLTLRHIHGHLE